MRKITNFNSFTSLKKYFLLLFYSGMTIILINGCIRGNPSEDPPIHLNPNMDDQPRYDPQEESPFFSDGASMRIPVPGTLARGDLREDKGLYDGVDGKGNPLVKAPVFFSRQLLERGQERFDIFCAPCHSRTGDGKGMVVQRGYILAPSFHLDYMCEYPDGHIYNVISNGIRNMPSYKHQIPVADRWAIVGYLRALQRSQKAGANDVPGEILKELN